MYVKRISNSVETVTGPFQEVDLIPANPEHGAYVAGIPIGGVPEGAEYAPTMIGQLLGYHGRFYVMGDRGETISFWDLGSEVAGTQAPPPVQGTMRRAA